jgi:RHS repeat-associated protein
MGCRAHWVAGSLGAAILALVVCNPRGAGAVLPGGGKDAAKGNDCLVVLDGLDPSDVTVEGKKKQVVICTDCDGGCDDDGLASADGSCTFVLSVCTNQPGIPGCEPAPALTRLRANAKVAGRKGKIDLTAGQSLLEGSVCGPPVEVVVPLRKGGAKPGKAVVSLSALRKRSKADGLPKRSDKDKLQLLCMPRPAGQSCPPPPSTSTTLVATTTTTTPFPTSSTVPGTTSTTTSGSTSSTVTTSSTTTSTSSTTLPGTLPPDPSTVAPPLSSTGNTAFGDAVAFLWQSGIQTGLDPGALEGHRVAVVRGRVLDDAGVALPGVRVSLLDHPELGQTLSRADGGYDLVVNGGGPITLRYEKDGFLAAQRQVTPPWNDYAMVDDVALMAPDPQVTMVDLGAADAVMAEGSTVADADGTRTAALLFPAGTSADMVMPDGSTHPVSALHVHITEFTVGDMGPAAMPAALPPTSAYTYAVEYTADEAAAAGATDVVFSQPIFHYVENFLGFPVGDGVPVGFYDRERGTWVPSDNGRVVKIVGVTGDLAEVDVDGSGNAADGVTLASLGFTDGERRQLAAAYAVGQELWRVPIPHFSAWDTNWPFGPPVDPQFPPTPAEAPPKSPMEPAYPCNQAGSVIGCHDQALGESLPLPGTPYRLHYQSERVPGRRDRRTATIPLTGPDLDPRVKAVELEIRIAGRLYTEHFAPQPDLSYEFLWDGRDAYGRPLLGTYMADVRIGNVYDGVYGSGEATFGSFPETVVTGDVTRREVTLWVEGTFEVEGTIVPLSLGGWTLSAVHFLGSDGSLYRGDGRTDPGGLSEIDSVAGRDDCSGNCMTTPAPATDLYMGDIASLAAAPDGSLYVAATNGRVYRIGRDGIADLFAGGGSLTVFEDVPATQAILSALSAVAVGPDGSVYVGYDRRISRIDTDGILHPVAGDHLNPQYGQGGDGGPALDASVTAVASLAVGPDGSVYFMDLGTGIKLRRIGPDGIIDTVVDADGSKCSLAPCGEDGPARAFRFSFGTSSAYAYPGLAIGPDGSLFVADYFRVLRVGPDGIIHRFAGGLDPVNDNCIPPADCGDGGPALDAKLYLVRGLSVAPDGTVYIVELGSTDGGAGRVRRVTPDGIINRVAGLGPLEGASTTCVVNCAEVPCPCGDGGPAAAAPLRLPRSVALTPDGAVLVADKGRVRQVGTVQRRDLVPSADGHEAYEMDPSGRHLRTLDALTGAERLAVTYDSAGRVTGLTDGDGNITSVERNAAGDPTAIVAPGGQRVTLSTDPDGYLTSVAYEDGTSVQLDYDTGAGAGLLTSMIDRRGGVHTYAYDAQGRLTSDTGPAGGATTLTRTDETHRYEVDVADPAARHTIYGTEELSDGRIRRTRLDPGGGLTEVIEAPDGSRTVTYPDGTVATVVAGPDPRWGMRAPIVESLTVAVPGQAPVAWDVTRTVTLASAADPLSVLTLQDATTVNGQTYTEAYDGATRQLVVTSPTGNQLTAAVDAEGRPARMLTPAGIEPTQIAYDGFGRVVTIAKTPQSWMYAYDARNRLLSRTDALGAQLGYGGFDGVDRPTEVTLPGGEIVGLGYDGDGNPLQITMPSAAVHALGWSPRDLLQSYLPPGGPGFALARGPDGTVQSVTLPSGRAETFTHDAAGRLAGIAYPEASVTFAYTDATQRVASVTRTPLAGAAQSIAYAFDGPFATSATFSGAASGSCTWTYDGTLSVADIAVTDAGGDTDIAIARDADGVVTARGPFTLTRDGPGGRPTSITDGTLSVTLAYDGLGRVTTRTHTVAGQPMYALGLSYDDAGRIVERTESVAGGTPVVEDYGYDPDGQLTDVVRDTVPVEHFTYDLDRNRVGWERLGVPQTASVDAQDRLLQQGAVTYTFDDDGYLTQRGSAAASYSTAGEPLQVSGAGPTVDYAYDGLRRRTARTAGGETTQYLYCNPDATLQVTSTRTSSGTTTVYHYDDDGRLLAVDRAGVRYYVATDQLGSPRVVTDDTGIVVRQLDYDAFGAVRTDTNPAFPLAVGFAGGLADPDTALVRFGFRDYDPEAGRWLARDPALYQGGQSNLYAYVFNDPVDLVDPSGLGNRGAALSVSAYDAVGAGTKITVTNEGMSACVEVGAGAGASAGLDFAEKPDADTFTFFGEGGVKLGPASLGGGLDATFDTNDFGKGHCVPNVKPKLNTCIGPVCLGLPSSGGVQVNAPNYPDGGSLAKQMLTPGVGLQLKAGGRYCQMVTW